MFNDIVFNGNKVILRSGRWSKAEATDLLSVNYLNDGVYGLDLNLAADGKMKTYDTSLFSQTNQPTINNRLLHISPVRVHNNTRIQPAFLHDYRYQGVVSGIKVHPSFFDFMRAYSWRLGKQKLHLKIDRANKSPWMATAQHELGEHEISGSKANPKILAYFKSAKFWGTDDSGKENAWCASFTAWVMEQHGYTPPKNSFRAKSWANFGTKVINPTYGAIGIKSRTGGGHVAFVVGASQDGKSLYMLGGNQSDEVNIRQYDRNVWETFVVPSDYDASDDWLPTYQQGALKSSSES